MERKFTNDDFEGFLRQNADGLRMRPADKVWEGISKDLNKKRRRIKWGLGAFLLTACTLGYLSVGVNSDRKTVGLSEHNGQALPGNNKQFPKPTLAYKNTERIKQEKAATALVSPRLFNNERNGFAVSDAIAERIGLPDVAEQNPTGTGAESFWVDSDPFSMATEQSNLPALLLQPRANQAPAIEDVVNLYKPGKVKKQLSAQWYFTPTISYRRLSENKSYLRSLQGSTAPSAVIPANYDVNNIVTHKPGMGFEFGLALKYPLTQRLKLRSGLQLNATRYEIKAYNAATELTTIMLNSRTAGANPIYRTSSLGTTNANGTQTDWLQNFYFQVSAPVGAEFNVFDNHKVQFGVATTIQPTYVLSDRAFLISADYKKYAEVPELTRRWNVNTAVETYVAYSTGRLNWQVGPQIRYQLLSSFVTKYPVKENLFEYGLKVGISLNRNQ